MKPVATLIGIGLAIIVIVISLVAYSYTQIQISLTDISFAGIEWAPASLSTLLKLASSAITGNTVSAVFSLIEGINLNLVFDLTNHGFFPVYIPDLSYDLLVNDITVGHGTSIVEATIYPGETKRFPMLQNFQSSSLMPGVNSIIDSGGIMNIQVKGTGYFKFLGLTVPVPFESSKQISIKNEVLNYLNKQSPENQR